VDKQQNVVCAGHALLLGGSKLAAALANMTQTKAHTNKTCAQLQALRNIN
jgi:hypothetical protein